MRLLRRPLALPSLVFAGALVVGALAAVPASAAVASPAAPTAAATSLCPDAATTTFGPNVCVFNDTMSQSANQADLNAIATQQVPVGSQFNDGRYSVFFEPGTYGSAASPLVFQVGYYTQVAGLGQLPSDTVVNGANGWSQSSAGVDSHITVAGTAVTSSSNTIKEAVTGVSMTLTSDSVGTTQTLTVGKDVSGQKTHGPDH